jgi:hypothetical protein
MPDFGITVSRQSEATAHPRNGPRRRSAIQPMQATALARDLVCRLLQGSRRGQEHTRHHFRSLVDVVGGTWCPHSHSRSTPHCAPLLTGEPNITDWSHDLLSHFEWEDNGFRPPPVKMKCTPPLDLQSQSLQHNFSMIVPLVPR